MTEFAQDVVVLLLRATALLAVSALLVRGLIWWLRPSSPTVRRIGWFLVLVQGMVLFHLPLKLAWEHDAREVPALVLERDSGEPDEAPLADSLPSPEPSAAPRGQPTGKSRSRSVLRRRQGRSARR